MLSRDKKLQLAKAKQRALDEKNKPQEVIGETGVEKQAIEDLHNGLNNLADNLQNFLDNNEMQEAMQKGMTQLNNATVMLVKAIEDGILLNKQPISLDAVTIKNLNELVIPKSVTVKNPTTIPKGLATDAELQKLAKTVEDAFNELAKAVEAPQPKAGQEEKDYVPFRRVVMRNNRLVFDDTIVQSFVGGGGGGSSSGGGGDGAINDGANGSIKATVHDVATQVSAGENGIVTNSVIHGKTTAGGGSYVDVKVTPSGSLSTNGEQGILNTGGTRIDPATENTLANLLIEMQINNGAYAQKVDTAGSITYRGWAVPGTLTSSASWRITRITDVGGGDYSMDFADGDNNFDNVWDNRATTVVYS